MPFKRKEIIMKNVFKKLTCLVLPFMILGCSHVASESKPAESSVPASKASSQNSKQSEPAKSSSNKPSSEPHVHTWSEEWDYDGTTHWHPCTDPTCTGKSGIEAHVKSEVGFFNPVNQELHILKRCVGKNPMPKVYHPPVIFAEEWLVGFHHPLNLLMRGKKQVWVDISL